MYVQNPSRYYKYAKSHNLEWLGDPEYIPHTAEPTLWRCTVCGSSLQTSLNCLRLRPHRCGGRINPNNFVESIDALALRLGLTWYGPEAKIISDEVVWIDSKGRKIVAPIDFVCKASKSKIDSWFDLADEADKAFKRPK